jgi:hypothetical protein
MFLKKLGLGVCICFLIFSMVGSVTGLASAEFASGDTVSANKTYENAYLAGSTLAIDGEVKKDLIGAGGTVNSNGSVSRNLVLTGGTVTIKSSVGGSIFVAGGTVIIDSNFVGGSVRVTGGTVTLSGNFSEDILVAGGDVTLKNANVAGDVYVGTGTLTVQGSNIKGKIQGQYSELKGTELKPQVLGSIDIKKVESDEIVNKPKNIFDYINFSWELSVIFVTLLVCWVLSKRNRLAIPSIKWGGLFGKDILIGLGAFVLPTLAMIVLLIAQLFPLAILLPAIVGLEIVASLLVLPIYVGNFIKNSFNFKLGTFWMILISYLILLAISLLSNNIGALAVLSLVSGVFILANVGFIIRTGWLSLNQYLANR